MFENRVLRRIFGP